MTEYCGTPYSVPTIHIPLFENTTMTTQNVTPLDELPDSTLIDNDPSAGYLGVKPNTLAVWRATKRYRIPFVKIGKRVKYKAGDLKKFIAAQTFS